MEEITILLVEDDFLNRRHTRKVFTESGYKVLEAKNREETLALIASEKVDLLILDINLGENQQDGISLGGYLKEKYSIPFIYLTAYESSDVIKEAINTYPLAYLTKPFKNADLIASVELALQRSSNREQDLPFIIVKGDKYNVKLPLERIDCIGAEGNYLLVYSNHKVYKCRCTIKEMLEILPQNMFVQTHRAYIVNKAKIEMFSPNMLIVNSQAIPVSKNYINEIQSVYNFSDK